MAIQVQCICGRELTLREEMAGKVIRCPQCAQALPVPEVVEEAVEVVEEAVAGGPPPLPRPQQKAGRQITEVDEIEVVEEAVSAGPPPLAKAPRKESYKTPPPSRRVEAPSEPKKKKKKKGSVYSETYAKEKQAGSLVFDEGWFGSGIIGGAAMSGLGLVLFIIIAVIGFWSIYALILAAGLFFAGMLAMLKGLMDLYDE